MLDEPSMGLAPSVADTIFERISQIHREDGVTILLVEQRVAEALERSDHGYVLETGHIVLAGPLRDVAGRRSGAPLVSRPDRSMTTSPTREMTSMTTPGAFGRRTAIKMGLAATAAAALPVRRARAQNPKEVKIALVVPLSGPWARQGILEQMGAEMAIEDVNKAGGIKALGGAKLKLVLYDTGDTAEKAKNAAQRLVAQEPDVVGGIGCWLSSFTLAATEVSERAELPWLTLSYSDLITSRGFKYVFQTSPTAEAQATALLPRVVDLATKPRRARSRRRWRSSATTPPPR